jgi:hypothetical protein
MAVKAFTMVYTKFESNILNIYLSKSLHYSESELNLDNLFLGPQSTQSIVPLYREQGLTIQIPIRYISFPRC